ncbi:MAG: hypothetical protein ABL914_06320 [Novosphingobium sp.]|uniref:hypothetical protein n=1 Tax=Novosphingobium sp. TaxID=1874826 RepID=UPI0032BC68BF
MNLPKIDLSALPDLDTLTSAFGSIMHTGRVGGSDDTIIEIMVVIYEIIIQSGT